MTTKSSELNIYLHTHWDREWYLPYETFRTQLVTVVRNVLDLIDQGDIPNFLLDGQSLAITDVVEVDPTLGKRLSAHMKSGKLGAGPWMVLADQMLVSGESLIRNLKIGLDACERYGPASRVGYCPDTFGHTQDLPRILNGFGIKNAFVWRGVPGDLDNTVFAWQSPDGSSVNAYHLSFGYYQTNFHGDFNAGQFADKLSAWTDLNGPKLLPVGGDHLLPPKHFLATLAELEKELHSRGVKINFHTIPLATFARQIETAGNGGALPVLRGELRDNRDAARFERAYMLQGVLSSRLYLKRANRIQEHRLSSVIEPLMTLASLSGAIQYPNWEIEHAWKLLIENHPHDSICGCSVDEVHDEMVIRTNRFHQALDAIEKKAAGALFADQNKIATFARALNMVTNPSLDPENLLAFNLTQDEISTPVRFQWAEEMHDAKPFVSDAVQIVSMREEPQVFTAVGEEPLPKSIKIYDGWVWVDKLKPLSITDMQWRSTAIDKSVSDVILAPRSIDNGLLRLEISEAGELIVEAKTTSGKSTPYKLGHAFRDIADAGDTYNHDPIISDTPVVSRVLAVSHRQMGPLVGSLSVTYELDIPLRVIAMESEEAIPFEKPGVPERAVKYVRSSEIVKHEVTTEISLKRGMPIVYFESKWKNKSEDHLLEIVFSTGKKISKTISENHFSVVERLHNDVQVVLPVAAGHEAPLDRYPCQRFFIASDQIFFNLGMPEYAVEGENVSLTALRAVSVLNRARLRTRGGGAGPSLATPAANCLGENIVSYGWAPSGVLEGVDDILSEAYSLADQFENNIWLLLTDAPRIKNEGEIAEKSLVEIDNPSVRVRSLHMSGDGNSVILRLLNVTAKEQNVSMKISKKFRRAFKTRLDGEKLSDLNIMDAINEPFLKLTLSENELATLKLDVQS